MSGVTGSFTEDFEAGSKRSYVAADVTLGSGTWNLSDTLIGTSSSDVKTGSKAARVRNSGRITMGFDHTTGVGTVTVHHARYGSDPNGSWGLFVSQDHGVTFTQIGSTVSTTASTFATATFAVNIAGDVRFDIRKLDGGSNRIDIDDVTITDLGTGGSDAGAGDAGTNPIQTVFVIVMENHNWSSIKGSPSAPYINNTLLPMGAHAENYNNVPGIHPSEPNYLWLEAGTNFGIANDNNPSSNHQSTTQHLVTQLQTAGILWKSYQEGISGTTCPLTATGLYAPKHNPMVYFDDVTNTNSSTSQNCIQHVRPYTELATDLQNNTVARYNFITPNLCNDMHNSTGCATSDEVANGDTWLSTEVPKILASQAYQQGGVILITWDESEGGDFPIGMIVLSPMVKAAGYSNTISYNHGSTLRTVQEIFGLTPLLGGAATSTDLSDMFSSFGGGGGSLTCPGPGNPKQNGGACGVERWAIKVGTDPSASSIPLTAVPNTIAALVALPANGGGSSRTSPTETTIYELKDVVLTELRSETNDSDYHLVISDGTHTMIAEIPYPQTCGAASTWACFISRARSEVDAMFNVTATPQFPSATVTVRGVGFFDALHGQNGVAPNGIELHPILELCFGTGCTPD